jgi:DNA-directed RNA polymerase specialized sigma24 family protein
MHDRLQHLARRDRQAYTLLYTHVVSEVPVPEIAALQGMSRSAVYRRLTWAKTECRKTYQTRVYVRQ